MSQIPVSVVGYAAPKFIEFAVRNIPDIASIKLFRTEASRPIQQDTAISAQSQSLISHALAIRERLGLPFWDSLLLYLSTHPVNADDVFKRAKRHNSQDRDSFFMPREECSETQIYDLINALAPGRFLAISSAVLTKQGEKRHLPMLDFHCQASAENDVLVKSVIAAIGLGGYVAKSGRSYHFYGRNLIDEQSLITTLGQSLLFCPIVDRAWIAHQLLERACGLRISPGKDYQGCPEIIYEV